MHSCSVCKYPLMLWIKLKTVAESEPGTRGILISILIGILFIDVNQAEGPLLSRLNRSSRRNNETGIAS